MSGRRWLGGPGGCRSADGSACTEGGRAAVEGYPADPREPTGSSSLRGSLPLGGAPNISPEGQKKDFKLS